MKITMAATISITMNVFGMPSVRPSASSANPSGTALGTPPDQFGDAQLPLRWTRSFVKAFCHDPDLSFAERYGKRAISV